MATTVASTADLVAWAQNQTFRIVTATRDSNGAIMLANIVWPDGTAGVYTADLISPTFPGATDAWHATYQDMTITQPGVTRDVSGAVIYQPSILVGTTAANSDDITYVPKTSFVTDYPTLRAYAGIITRVTVTTFGIAGDFVYDATDPTSADNGGTIIVDAQGRRWKRLYTGALNVKWFGAKGDGSTDDTTAIQKAIDTLVPQPFGGSVFMPKGTYLTSLPLQLARSIKLYGEGKDATVIKLTGNYTGIVQKIINGGSTGAQNVTLSDLQILGTDDGSQAAQHGIECSSSLQYSTFERILINKVGGNGINVPVTPLGAIYNSFRDIEILNHHGYGAYIAGNFGQNVFERVRSFGGYSHGFVIDGSNNSGSNPLSNTFIGCACEHTSNATTDVYGVYFLSNSVYNAYDTLFLDCYWEIDAKASGDSAAFYIGAAKGVQIIGGHIAFCHWGIVAASQYSEGIYVQGVCFYQTATWAGSANVGTKAMLSCLDSNARIHVGPQCTAQINSGITWPTIDANSVGRIFGYLNFQNKTEASRQLTFTPPQDVSANRPAASAARRGELWFTQSSAGFADHLEACIKKSDDTYQWVSVGGQWDYRGTFAFPGVTLAAGSTQSNTYNVTGVNLGRLCLVSPSADLGGLIMTAAPSGSSILRLTFYNPTGASVSVPSGTWSYGSQI